MRLHALEHAVEVVGIHLDEFAVPQTRQRLRGLTGKIPQDAHDEWQFLQFDGVADLDVISHMHARRPDPVQFGMYAFSSHNDPRSLLVRPAAEFVAPQARSLTVTLTTH